MTRKILSLLRNPYAWVPALCLLVYALHSGPGPIRYPYFAELAAAFLRGELHIADPSNTHDLVLFDGRYYLYWPPVPALYFMPLVGLWGEQLSINATGWAFGALNIFLLMHSCRLLSARFGLRLRTIDIAAIGLFWGLGTTHFQLSANSEVWHVSQIMAQTALLGAVVAFLFGRHLMITGTLFALAVYTRNDLVFAGLFFLALHRALYPQRRGWTLIQHGALFVVPFMIATGLNAWYNWARFGDPTENGLAYHQMSDYFHENFEQHGYFSIHYLPHNFWVEMLRPPAFSRDIPFLGYDPEGFGMLWASPLFFLVLPAGAIWLRRLMGVRGGASGDLRGYWWISGGSLAAAIPIALTIFLVMGTGWMQWGARYTLDFQAFFLFFVVAAWPQMQQWKGTRVIAAGLIALSLYVQLVGAGRGHWW